MLSSEVHYKFLSAGMVCTIGSSVLFVTVRRNGSLAEAVSLSGAVSCKFDKLLIVNFRSAIEVSYLESG